MKFFFITIIVFSLALSGHAQQTEKKVIKSKSPSSKEVFYVIKGTDIKHGEYSRMLRGVINISEKGQYDSGTKSGVWEYYDQNDEVEQRYDFDRNELIYNKYAEPVSFGITRSALIIDGELHENTTGELPILLGGMSKYLYYLRNSLKYPSRARDAQIEGTVIISATVNVDGQIVDEKIEGEAAYGLGEEALRIIQLLPDDWLPVSIEGKPVAIRLFIPIRFVLS